MSVGTFRKLHERQRVLRALEIEALSKPPLIAGAVVSGAPEDLDEAALERATAPAAKRPPMPVRR